MDSTAAGAADRTLGCIAAHAGAAAPPTERYPAVRGVTEAIAGLLSAEDAAAQSMTACSPAKWHLAHTTWFFETFVLDRVDPDRERGDPRLATLFNSYYNAVGEAFAKSRRGLLTRPSLKEVLEHRRAVDAAVIEVLESGIDEGLAEIVETGLQHEQQHQELLLADVKHLFSCNPLEPAYADPLPFRPASKPRPLGWVSFDAGVREIGHDRERAGGFAYDNEGPRHPVHVAAFDLADRLVTNAEWLAFVEDGGYRRVEVWLDDGWRWRQEEGVETPFYWRRERGAWWEFTLRGSRTLALDEPVCHVSWYEAEAFARWCSLRDPGCRLPTEFEWETAAAETGAAVAGNLLDAAVLHTRPARDDGLTQLFGDAWEWTRSDYAPYPGYRPPPGAIGEYNGKFMSGKRVLRGGCFATPAAHARPTYRNYYRPSDRWCVSGVRLARDRA